MTEENLNALANEISIQLKEVRKKEAGSKERQAAVNDLVRLCQVEIDATKTEYEFEEKYHRREMDALKEQHELEKQLREHEERQYRRELDALKEQHEYEEKCLRRELDALKEQHELERQQREEEFKNRIEEAHHKDRVIGYCVTGGTTVLSLIAASALHKRTLKFEETGIVRSQAARIADSFLKLVKPPKL